MCIVFVGVHAHPRFILVVAANRDEYMDRPTETAHAWPDQPIYGGRDKRAGGTWLAMSTNSPRWAALTNIKGECEPRLPGSPSRGIIVTEWLLERECLSPAEKCAKMAASVGSMAGFNCLFGDVHAGRARCCHFANRSSSLGKELEDGVHGLANSIGLNCTGPVEHGRKLLSQVLQGGSDDIDAKALTEEIFNTVLTDGQYFIDPADYCTRSSAVLLIDRAGKSHFVERPRSTDSKRADIWMTNSCVMSQNDARE